MTQQIERIIHISKNFQDAEVWDILQHVQMSPEKRQQAAAELRKRAYGKDVPDVREFYQQK